MKRRIVVTWGLLALGIFTHGDAKVRSTDVSDELIAKLTAAKKPAVGKPLIIDGKTVCGPKGKTKSNDSKMKDLNNNKNRTDEPAPNDFIPIDWDDMTNLPVDKASDIQGAPVSVIGFLSRRVKEENEAPGESTNCNLLQSDEVDWHMYLTKQSS